jgi:hypothetical protein
MACRKSASSTVLRHLNTDITAMPRDGHNAEVVNPGSPGVRHERVPQTVKCGVFHTRLLTGPRKSMRETGGMVARLNRRGACLPDDHLSGMDEHP